MRSLRSALFYLAPALLQLARLAPLPLAADRLLAALVFVAQAVGLALASRKMARGLAAPGDRVEAALFGVTLFLAVPALVIAWLGAAGLARPLPATIACGLVALALHLRAPGPESRREPAPAALALDRFEVGALAFIVLAWGWMSLDMLRETTRDADSVWYHLTTAAEIVRTGSIRANPILTVVAVGYPAAREAILAWLVLPLRSANVALLCPLEIATALGALYAVGRSFGVARPAMLGAVAIYAACPTIAYAAIEQKNDLFLAAMFLLAWRFLRELARTGLRRHAVMAGLAGGLLASTKITGVILLGVLLILWLVGDVLARGGLPLARRRVRVLGLALGVSVLVGGVWYARNFVLWHNPVYPKEIALFGHTLFPGVPRLDRQFALTTLGLHPRRIWQFRGQLFAMLGPASALALVLPIVASLAALRNRARFREGAWLSLGALPVVLFVVYLLLPYSVHPRGTTYWYVQPRFLLPFFATVCVGLAALVPDRGRGHLAGLAVLGAIAVVGAALWVPAGALAIGLALALAATSIPFARLAVAVPWRRVPAGTTLALAAALPLALAVLALDAHGELLKDHPTRGYRADPVEGWGDVSMWVRGHVANANVLYTGTIQMYPLYGPGLTNTLFYQKTEPGHDDVEALYRAAIDSHAAYIVSFSPVKLRYGAEGERFEYGPSPTRALEASHPGEIEIVYVSGHADVARVIKPHDAAR